MQGGGRFPALFSSIDIPILCSPRQKVERYAVIVSEFQEQFQRDCLESTFIPAIYGLLYAEDGGNLRLRHIGIFPHIAQSLEMQAHPPFAIS